LRPWITKCSYRYFPTLTRQLPHCLWVNCTPAVLIPTPSQSAIDGFLRPPTSPWFINNHNAVLWWAHFWSFSNERVNGACNFPKPLKSELERYGLIIGRGAGKPILQRYIHILFYNFPIVLYCRYVHDLYTLAVGKMISDRSLQRIEGELVSCINAMLTKLSQ